jgi:two-component system, chemotaxis family, chemotaxis protein CheY
MQRGQREAQPFERGIADGASPARVFVVEDNDLTRRTLKHIIGRDGRLVLVGEASNGVSALEGINVLQPDLVCLDIHLPRMDGLAVLRTLREKYPPMAVVIITGESTPEVLTQAHSLGADGFVVKPFNAGKVLDTIHHALARNGGTNSDETSKAFRPY